jgi:hypothetical protein
MSYDQATCFCLNKVNKFNSKANRCYFNKRAHCYFSSFDPLSS